MLKEKNTEREALKQIHKILHDNEAGGKLKAYAIASEALGYKDDQMPGSQLGQQ